MSPKQFTAEQIANKLREAEALLAQGKATVAACRSIGVTEQASNALQGAPIGLLPG